MLIIRLSESGSPTFAETPMLQVDMEDVIDESELYDHLRSQENEESIEDINEELQTNLEDTDSDSEDLQGASLDDALDSIEGKIDWNMWRSGQIRHIGNLWN